MSSSSDKEESDMSFARAGHALKVEQTESPQTERLFTEGTNVSFPQERRNNA